MFVKRTYIKGGYMKILYLTYSDLDNKNFIGVNDKVFSQIKAMKSLKNQVCYTYMKENKFYYNDGVTNELIYEFKDKYDVVINKYKNLLRLIEINNIECLYIRYSSIDIFFIKFIRKLNREGIKIYYEIPTFPYDKEITVSLKWVIMDRVCRRFISRYINAIIVSSCKVKKIFGAKSIFIDNCVDSNNIKFLNRDFNNNIINIIAVSYIRKTNGYDRLIEGLNNYYKKGGERKININFIGKGEEVEFLNSLVEKYNLKDKVKFVGSKTGNELDNYFEGADLAIGSLADHRNNIYSKAPLKAREYCARGIPFISAVDDPGFLSNEEFILKFPANEEFIDINKVIQFYDNLKGRNISNKMRQHAIDNFNWEKQYSKIKDFNNIAYIKEKFI